MLWAARSRLTFSPGCPFSPWSVAPITAMCKRVQGGERERERHKHRHQRQRHAPPPQNPGSGAGMSRLAPAPAPVLLPILTVGCPSKERLQNTVLSQAGDGPTLFRAGLFGMGSCRWQAGVHVSKPTVSKPSWCMRWQQEAPNPGGC